MWKSEGVSMVGKAIALSTYTFTFKHTSVVVINNKKGSYIGPVLKTSSVYVGQPTKM